MYLCLAVRLMCISLRKSTLSHKLIKVTTLLYLNDKKRLQYCGSGNFIKFPRFITVAERGDVIHNAIVVVKVLQIIT